MTALKIGVIMGTTRDGRFCDKVTDWILELARENSAAEFEKIDLRDYPMPLFNEQIPPLYAPAQDPNAQKWNARLLPLDGYIFVTAEYNHGVPGGLKNALDFSYQELIRKPAAFVGYGGVGAARAIEQLRLIVAELQMAPLRNAVHVGLHEFLGVLQNGKNLSDYPYLIDSAKAMFTDLEWWSDTLKAGRERASGGAGQ